MAIILKTELPGPKSRALMEARNKHVARGPFHVTPLFIARAQGAVLEDVDGNRLIDCASGIGVVNVGHAAAPVVRAVKEQLDRYLHLGFNVTPYEPYVRVCEKLNAAAPGKFTKRSFLANSGAEAVENAVKIARVHTGKTTIACFEHAFHGRTFMAMGLTAKEKPYKHGFGPLPGPLVRAPFPDAYRWPSKDVSRECFQAFEAAVGPLVDDLAAVIIEPVLGEGGFIPAPPDFLTRLREFCNKRRVLLIADEIQTGFGRTGTLFASELLGLVPDLLVTAKGLAGGMPLSAVTGRAEVMDAPNEGAIGGTFGGNPAACAAALVVFEMFEGGTLLARADALGTALEHRLHGWKERFPFIGDARGLGPMRAVELVKDRKTKEPYPEAAKKLSRACYEKGVVLMNAGTWGNVIRFLMPLVISPQEREEALDVVESCLGTL